MRPAAIVGVVLIVLGVVMLAYQGITYTSHDTVLDVGAIHATVDRQKTMPISPVLGGVALVGGIILLVAGMRKRSA